MDLCLDVLAGTSPAPLGVFQPWSCTPAPLWLPHVSPFCPCGELDTLARQPLPCNKQL